MPRTDWEETRIGSGRLILHCGAQSVAPAVVADVPTPDPVGTHHCIPHTALLDKVQHSLEQHGFEMGDQAHALYADGLRYFALLAITHPSTHFPDGQWVLGVRNSHDKSFAASGMLGMNLFLCDNLCFSGGTMFSLSRKHTKNILGDIDEKVTDALGHLTQKIHSQEQRISHYKVWNFHDEADKLGVKLERGTDGNVLNNPFANDFLLRSLRTGCVAPSRVKKVINEFYNPAGPGGHADFAGGSAWTMMNAFSEVHREYPSVLTSPRRDSRLSVMLDGTTDLAATSDTLSPADVIAIPE